MQRHSMRCGSQLQFIIAGPEAVVGVVVVCIRDDHNAASIPFQVDMVT